MTKKELIAKLDGLPDDTRVTINEPDIAGGVWHKDIEECFIMRSQLLNNGVEVYLGIQPYFTTAP